MSTRKKNSIKKDDFFSSVNFCTECGKSLDDFALENPNCDKETIKFRYKQCVETGKFKGDMCSKLFITDDENEEPRKSDDLPPNVTFPEDVI